MSQHRKVINALSDSRFAPESLATGLIREPLDTQEMFIYSFIRYIYAINSYASHGLLPDDMSHITSWSGQMAEWFETHLTT